MRSLLVVLVVFAALVSPRGQLLSAAPVQPPLQSAQGVALSTDAREAARRVPSEARERDQLRASQVGPLATTDTDGTSVTGSATTATTSVPAGKVGLALADVTVGSGSTLEKAQQTGAGWLLGWVSWANVEPSRGNFAWLSGAGNDLDNVANAGSAAGMQVLVRLHTPPGWATGGTWQVAQIDLVELQRSAEAIARRGAGKVAAYQVFNEPNLNYEWGHDVDATAAAGYARVLRAAYLGLKAGDPNAVVVSAGLANGACCGSMDDLAYLEALYQAGAKGGTHFDVLGTHPYGGSYAPEVAPADCQATCFRRAEAQRQIMVQYGDSATPMWATETGWLHDTEEDLSIYFNWMKVSPEQQADFLVRAYQYAQANWPWMQRLFTFNLDHSTAMWCGTAETGWIGPCYPTNTSVHWYSLLNPDRTARPAYTALRQMLSGTYVSPTSTPTATSTASVTPTSSPTQSPTQTSTPTPSPTVTWTVTPTSTSTATATATATATSTPVPTSTPVVVAPAAPTGLAASAQGSFVRLTWSASPTADVTYSVYRGTTAGGEKTLIDSEVAETRYDDRSVSRRQTYYYQVTAVNVAGESARSNEAAVRTR